MSLFYASLNSGSNGNCYYVGTSNDGVLVDAGIPLKEIEKRADLLGIDLHTIKALIITHEHTDHIRGAYKLAKKYALPVYSGTGTINRSYFRLNELQFYPIAHGVPVNIGALQIFPFSKQHDAADPYSVVVNFQNRNIGIITDVGAVCENLKVYFGKCHVAFLESNYDTDMLQSGKYPPYLKARIRGGMGHLSNAQALELVQNHGHHELKHVLPAHISKENNRTELVSQVFRELEKNIRIDLALRDGASQLFEINETLEVRPYSTKPENVQLQMFQNL